MRKPIFENLLDYEVISFHGEAFFSVGSSDGKLQFSDFPDFEKIVCEKIKKTTHFSFSQNFPIYEDTTCSFGGGKCPISRKTPQSP